MTVRAKAKAASRPRGRAAQALTRSITAASRATLLIFGLIGVVGSLHVMVMLGVEVGRYSENSREIARLQGDIAALDRELAGLQAILDHARDQRYREHLARRQGFAYPGERRYFTVSPNPTADAPEPGSQD